VNELDTAKALLPWKVNKELCQDNELTIELFDSIHSIAKYSIVVNNALEFSVFVFHWPVPDKFAIYVKRRRSVRGQDIQDLLKYVEESSLCQGLPDDPIVQSVVVDPTGVSQGLPVTTVIRHSIPKVLSGEQFVVSVYFRSADCEVLVDPPSGKPCGPCSGTNNALRRADRRKTKSSMAPAKSKAALAACGPEKLRATVKETRLKCKQLEEQVQKLQRKIEEDGVAISEALEKDLLKIMGGKNLEATPHMKFFWEQQMRLLQVPKMGRRYHPQVIRFALYLHGKSPAAYRELGESGALILPSERVLRDYKNYFKPKAGINKENIDCLKEKTSSFSAVQRYVAVVMDEMKIQSNLVYDKVSGDLIGFVDLGDPMTSFANLPEDDAIASHALAFLVRGLCTDLKHIVAYFFTKDVTSFQIMPIFWKVVSVLELCLNLPVCAVVNDGASANRKFFRLHSKLAGDLQCDVVYRTTNVYAPSRFIYFFADSPHLMKTARNCLYNSGSGSCSRYMWNDGKYLLFKHIADLFYSDQEFSLHTLPKLTMDHIVLSPYSKMKVKLATQVLSRSVATALEESGDEEVLETAKFCGLMNDFFDCTNVRSLTEHVRKRNPLVKPYSTPDDERFTWLKDVFLEYLAKWRQSTLSRPGNYTPDARNKMFMSNQTYEGFKITVHSHIEVIRFLLAQGFQYVLSERFMQDVLEDYFGHQRAKGGRSDNPNAQQFGYNDLTIAAQRDIAPVVRGNVGGRFEKKKWQEVSNEPVRKRKK
jgi:hypothetical protein